MKAFVITMVGEDKPVRVEAHNDYHAVAEVANCAVNDVPLPIWRLGHSRDQDCADCAVRCYMPRDNTGRQWIVRDAPKEEWAP